jgi:Asp/Glu/hydantoin racemase
MKNIRIGLIHSVIPAIAAVEAALREHWPDAQAVSLYDESLYIDLAADRSLTPAHFDRIPRLLRYSADCGADAILVTGSLFGPAVVAARDEVDIPVLTSFDGLIDRAFELGGNFTLLATDPGTNRMLGDELTLRAEIGGRTLSLDAHHIPGATERLNQGDQAGHDRLVVERAEATAPGDAILLGQFSMGPTRPLVQARVDCPVLDAAEAAVHKLKAHFTGA